MIRSVCIFLAALPMALLGSCEPVFQGSDGGTTPSDSDASVEVPGDGSVDAGPELRPDAGLEEDGGVPDAGTASVARNGVWLTRNYVAYSSFYAPAVVEDLATRMSSQYEIGRLFVNVDRIGADGRFIDAAPKMSEFLENLAAWESRSGRRFEVYAWVNGSTTGTAAIDLTRPEVRAAVVEECQKLVAPWESGSYVAGTQRPFDGVQIDFEPSGFDQVRFNALLELMDELRTGFAAVGRSDALLSVAAHKLGTGGEYQWSPAFYDAMADRVDVLAAMTYNSGSDDGAAYQTWMRQQVTGVLKALSAPKRPMEVLFGLPSYPPNASHDPAAETIASGADGMRAAIAELESAADPALAFLGGAAVYLHTKGIADDGYARWDTEWWWFGHHWLQRW
ncbi:MAG: glycosyl hydrolase family 18 protein [Myxococcaceae bacterium]